MKLTNKHNLPEPFLNYATKDEYQYKEHRYSVTELLLPIREIILNRKHAQDIEQDVADMVPALIGTAVHATLEQHTANLATEQSVSCKVGSCTLSGRIDFLDGSTIGDYKTCSTSKVSKCDFEDWRMQGLMYAWLIFKDKGEVMQKLRFIALMKDWSKIKSATSANYPQSPVYVWEYDIKDSDYDYIEAWIVTRIADIEHHIESGTLPECTNEERWYTGDKWAVYKNAGDKRAAAVLDTEQEAHDYITNKCGGVGQIEFRKGQSIKCDYYCNCCKFCKKGG